VKTNRFLDHESEDLQSPSGPQRDTANTPSAKCKSKFLMCAPLRIHDGADPHEGLWVGESSGRWHGNNVYAGALVAGQYLSVGCDVFLKAQPGQLQVPSPCESPPLILFCFRPTSQKLVCVCKRLYETDWSRRTA